jgi:hypothetical protein
MSFYGNKYLPVFIVGEARSGSSLLNRVLEIHPSFRPQKVWHIESKILNYSSVSFRLNDFRNSGPFKYMLLDEDVFHQFLHEIRHIQGLHKILSKLKLSGLCNRYTFSWFIFGNAVLLRKFFKYAAEARGCQRIVEKTPNNAIHVWKFKKAFPDCKIIYIYRHPVDVFASYRKLAISLGEHSWADITPEYFSALYANRVTKILDFYKQKKSDCLLIRYENFVENPESVLKNLFSFIGESYDNICLDPMQSDRDKRNDSYITKKITKQTKKWQDWIEINTAKIIEENLATVMRKLGYIRYTSNP